MSESSRLCSILKSRSWSRNLADVQRTQPSTGFSVATSDSATNHDKLLSKHNSYHISKSSLSSHSKKKKKSKDKDRSKDKESKRKDKKKKDYKRREKESKKGRLTLRKLTIALILVPSLLFSGF